MNFKKLAEDHIETALRRGYITFEETGEVKHLTGAQVTSLSLALIKGDFLKEETTILPSNKNMPSEMFESLASESSNNYIEKTIEKIVMENSQEEE